MRFCIKLFSFFVVLYMCAGCKTHTIVQEIPVEIIKTQIEYRDKYLKDSIYVHDSVSVYTKGDTVFKYKYLNVYKDRYLTDTIRITDSIDRPIYITKTKEVVKNELNKIQTFLYFSGIIFWGIITIYLLTKLKFK